MQFTYRVSEADYQRAWKLRVKGMSRNKIVVKTILFWVFVLVCLMLVWAVVTKTNDRRTDAPPPAAQQSSDESPEPSHSTGPSAQSLLENAGPFILIGGLWIFIAFWMTPRRMRQQYLKDPTMQGAYTIDVTPTAIAVENTAGVSSRMVWNLYDYWQERQGVIVLVNKSGSYFVISASGLSEFQQGELREMLSSVLPKK
jgi:hypothetical protein